MVDKKSIDRDGRAQKVRIIKLFEKIFYSFTSIKKDTAIAFEFFLFNEFLLLVILKVKSE